MNLETSKEVQPFQMIFSPGFSQNVLFNISGSAVFKDLNLLDTFFAFLLIVSLDYLCQVKSFIPGFFGSSAHHPTLGNTDT